MVRPSEVLLSGQLSSLSQIVDYAYIHSRFYRKRFEEVGFQPGDIKDFADLQNLPELTKTDLVDNMDDILCVPKSGLSPVTTGGTSGIHLIFYRDYHCSAYRRGIDLAIARYYGWKDGQWQGWLWGASQDLLQPSSLKGRLIRQWSDRHYFLDVSSLSNANYQKFVEDTKKYKPTLVSAYPSVACDLAERIEAGVIEPFRIPVVSLTAEPVEDFQKQKIQTMFAENVYERYGAREYGTAAIECPEHNGMHYFTDSVYLESTETSAGKGGLGTLLVTDLLNHAMPLIRYHTGDFGELHHSPCTCGLSSPRLRSVQGRESDIIWRSDGSGVAGLAIMLLIRKSMKRTRIQIVQEKIDLIRIRVEGEATGLNEELEALRRTFRENIGTEIRYKIESTERIERAPSGKYRFVISKVTRPNTD